MTNKIKLNKEDLKNLLVCLNLLEELSQNKYNKKLANRLYNKIKRIITE